MHGCTSSGSRCAPAALVLAALLCGVARPAVAEGGGIVVDLAADVRTLSPGATVTFRLAFANGDGVPRRILLPTCYAGEEFEFRDAAGAKVEWDGGLATHTVKTSLYPGRTILLPPGGTTEVRYRAHLASGYRLLFEDPGAGFGTGFAPGADPQADLAGIPREFIGCGRMFKLRGPGKVAVRHVYTRRPSDAEWNVLAPEGADASLEHLWIGTAESGTVELELR